MFILHYATPLVNVLLSEGTASANSQSGTKEGLKNNCTLKMWVPCATTSARDTRLMEQNELFQNRKPRLRLSEDTEMPKIGRNLMPSHQSAGQSPVVRDIVQRAQHDRERCLTILLGSGRIGRRGL